MMAFDWVTAIVVGVLIAGVVLWRSVKAERAKQQQQQQQKPDQSA